MSNAYLNVISSINHPLVAFFNEINVAAKVNPKSHHCKNRGIHSLGVTPTCQYGDNLALVGITTNKPSYHGGFLSKMEENTYHYSLDKMKGKLTITRL